MLTNVIVTALIVLATIAYVCWPRDGARHQEGHRVNPTRRGVIE